MAGIVMIDGVGWVGSGMVLLAYILAAAGRMLPEARSYQWLNLVGGVALMVNAMFHRALPSAVVNLVWLSVGAYGLAKGWAQSRRNQSSKAMGGGEA